MSGVAQHPWNEPTWARLTRERERSAHAWLFCGPAGLGKHALALRFAGHLLGGRQRDQELFLAATHPDVHVVMAEAGLEEGDDLLSRYALRYAEPGRKGAKPRSVITIDQVRRLIGAVATCAHSGDQRIGVIADAHRMNPNAGNALLKLLEEPPAGTVLILVSAQPERLPATVRSRCTRIEFRVPATDAALGWLAGRLPDATNCALLLDLAGGAPLQALAMQAGGFLETRSQLKRDLAGLLRGDEDPVTIAARWKDIGLHRCLTWLSRILVDVVRCRWCIEPGTLFNPDQRRWIEELANGLRVDELFEQIRRIGALLQDRDSALDASLLLEDLLTSLRGVTIKQV